MPVRVLVVDDSGFFRRRIVDILAAEPRIEVVGTAANGQEAVLKTAELRPDVITMDIEMPVMNGIMAVRRIMATHPTPVLMFSSLTHEGAQATLDALEAGAVDFLPKRFDDISKDREQAKQVLRTRVRQIGARGLPRTARPRTESLGHAISRPPPAAIQPHRGCRLVAIGSSTGGPVALQRVLSRLPADLHVPVMLIQHMPASFTPAFAVRLNQQCAISVKEAQDGEVLLPGTAYLAPGGRQLTLEQRAGQVCLRVRDSEPDQHYRPSVDLAFDSAAKVFPGRVLAVVMTGMGADGREGARALKRGGSTVWAQDEASCVIYGMPMAIVEAGLADQVLPLDHIGSSIAKSV